MKQLISIPLCSSCTIHEINSWVFEKANSLPVEATKQIREELKAIKLTQGACVVCNNNLISADCFENILKILEKYKIRDDIRKEFVKLFGFEL